MEPHCPSRSSFLIFDIFAHHCNFHRFHCMDSPFSRCWGAYNPSAHRGVTRVRCCATAFFCLLLLSTSLASASVGLPLKDVHSTNETQSESHRTVTRLLGQQSFNEKIISSPAQNPGYRGINDNKFAAISHFGRSRANRTTWEKSYFSLNYYARPTSSFICTPQRLDMDPGRTSVKPVKYNISGFTIDARTMARIPKAIDHPD